LAGSVAWADFFGLSASRGESLVEEVGEDDADAVSFVSASGLKADADT